MAATHVATAPLVIIKDRSGVDHYFYRDVPVAGDFDPERLRVLADEGLIGKVDTAAAPAGEPTMPTKSAPKPEWVAWAVHNGMDEEKAKAEKKEDLVAKYGPDAPPPAPPTPPAE